MQKRHRFDHALPCGALPQSLSGCGMLTLLLHRPNRQNPPLRKSFRRTRTPRAMLLTIPVRLPPASLLRSSRRPSPLSMKKVADWQVSCSRAGLQQAVDLRRSLRWPARGIEDHRRPEVSRCRASLRGALRLDAARQPLSSRGRSGSRTGLPRSLPCGPEAGSHGQHQGDHGSPHRSSRRSRQAALVVVRRALHVSARALAHV